MLADELQALGLQNIKNNPHGVFGDASLTTIYQIALWSRLANRLHLVLFSGDASRSESLYQTCYQFDWNSVFSADCSFRVNFHGISSQLRNEMYSGQVVKDAIVDYFRKISGERPNIDKKEAQVEVVAHLKHDKVTVSLDLVGYSLHQRGYRLEQGIAPIKENVAAALLMRSNWNEVHQNGGAFADIMCGSGTIPIEAALMASNTAPGLLRQDQAFPFWKQHDANLWQQLRQQAQSEVKLPSVQLSASDENGHMIEVAKANAKRAGMAEYITFQKKNLKQVQNTCSHGLLVINPPYGERIGDQLDLIPLYSQLGQVFHQQFQGWQASVITSDPMLAKAMGLRAFKQYAIYNGSLPCQLYCIRLDEKNLLRQMGQETISGPAEMLANRLKKNMANLKKWASQHQVECYRVYDADLPEYAFAIDKYADHYVLQEYMPPKSVPDHLAANRRLDVMKVVPQVFGINHKHMVIKQRRPQKEEQYQKTDDRNARITVGEGQAKFYVNLHDYLDTGLFLDHRLLRLQFAKLPEKVKFLNLFCYTATASVHAAMAGATTVNVDMSKTYLQWGMDNFKLNHLGILKHQFIHSDVMTWLKRPITEQFDVIYMDTPSFSNSKRMEGTLDIQRDHVYLIQKAMKWLSPNGKLYFSTHLRTFKLDEELMDEFKISNISRKTIDVDFKRDQKIHQCFLIEN
jgi:23S rRNA (guanine2445-N2)-methyltransferase / 23S rRNA (guanine2069-N7)-methyltransferase